MSALPVVDGVNCGRLHLPADEYTYHGRTSIFILRFTGSAGASSEPPLRRCRSPAPAPLMGDRMNEKSQLLLQRQRVTST